MLDLLGTLDEVEQAEEQADRKRVLAAESTKVAQEDVTTEVEREYRMWIKPTQEGLQSLLAASGEYMVDFMLPTPDGRRRIRLERDSAVLTLKSSGGDLKQHTEEHSDVGLATALSFRDNADVIHVVKRISYDAGDKLKELCGGKAEWNIDVFYIYPGDGKVNFTDLDKFQTLMDGLPTNDVTGAWIKVELEVGDFGIETIRPFLPVAYEEALNADTKDPDDRAMLDNFWDYNSSWA